MYRAIVLYLFLTLPFASPAADRLVPGSYPSLSAALAAASAGDTIRITDSGSYAENLVIDKNVAIEAASGQTPSIIGGGLNPEVIRFGPNSAGARLGSAAGGRITIDGAGDVNHTALVRSGPSSGNVTMENLKLQNPPDASLQAAAGVYPSGAGNTTLRQVEIDGGDLLHVGIRLDLLGGSTFTAENVKVHRIRPVLSGGSLGIYASSLKGNAIFTNCIILSYREALLIEGDNGTRYDLTFNNCLLRKAVNNNFDTFQVRGMTNIHLWRTVVVNPTQGRAIHLLPVSNATVTVDQCDLIGPIGLDAQASTGRTINITNSNVIATSYGIGLASTDASEAYLASFNNVVGSPAFQIFPVGQSNVTPGVTPNYTNAAAYDYRYTTPALLTASSSNGPLGVNVDMSNISNTPPSPTPTPTPTSTPTPTPTPNLTSPWTANQDQAYINAFRALYPPRNPPISVEAYLALYPMTRWTGSAINSQLLSLNNGTQTVFWGLDYHMDALNIAYKATHNPYYLTENLRMIRGVIAYRDDKRGVTLYDGSIAPGWGTTIYSNGQGRRIYAVHTGMAVFPILECLLLAQNEPSVMTALGSEFDSIRDDALFSLNYHNAEYFSGPSAGEGHYRFPPDYDQSAYRNAPIPGNMQSALGRALWISWKLTADTTHRDRALAIGTYIKNRMRRATDGAWYWEYQLPTNPASTTPIPKQNINSEDTSHAWLTASLPALLASEGQVFTPADVQLYVLAVLQGVGRLGQGVILPEVNGNPTRIDPSYSGGSSRWLLFSPFDSRVWPLISSYIVTSIASPNHMDTALLMLYQPKAQTGTRGWAIWE